MSHYFSYLPLDSFLVIFISSETKRTMANCAMHPFEIFL